MSRWLLMAAFLAGAVAPAHAQTCCAVSLRVRVPAGTGPVYIGGSLAELGPWHADGKQLDGKGAERTAHWGDLALARRDLV